MTSLLVTGGAGFIGSNFVRMLLASRPDARVVNLDALTYAGNPANLDGIDRDPRHTFVHASIGDTAAVEQIFATHRFDAVVNFAAESHVDRSIDTPEPFITTNVLGTQRLLDAARRHWKSLPAAEAARFRFLHVSTDEVFGSLGPGDPAFRESTPYDPRSPYSASKAASDHLVRAYHHTYGLPVLITNCSNNYGPRQFPEKLIPLIILNALDGKPLPIYGDGRNVRDWLYVEDHCSAIARVLDSGAVGETYCVGGRSERMNIEIVDIVCAELDRRAPRPDGKSYATLKTFVTDRPGHDRRYAIDCSKIERALGWKPLETLETGLGKTVAWYLENRAWCDDITQGRYQRQRLGGV